MQQSNSKPISTAAPRMEPTTIPAICPPDSPLLFCEAPLVALEVLVAEGEVLDVAEGNNGGIENMAGKVTPLHLPVTFDVTQHESVALGELDAQYRHRPGRFEEKPHSSDSFWSPVMHSTLSELLGSAQLVKSALI